MNIYILIPTNGGQELNYNHTIQRPLKEVKLFGEFMRDQLKPILTQGSIGMVIQNQSGKEIASLPPTGHKWEEKQ